MIVIEVPVSLTITDKAKEVFSSGLFQVWRWNGDDSEVLCQTYDEISEAFDSGVQLSIEVVDAM